MDALIRSAQLASARTRLSEARAVSVAPTLNPSPESESPRAALERQLRAEITAELKKHYDAALADAREEGYADGAAAGREDAARELARERAELREEVERAVAALEQAHESSWFQLHASVGEVAFAAVCRLVGEQSQSPAFVLSLVENTCARLRAEAVATARLHPRDINTLREVLSDERLHLRSLSLNVVADESLELGGCRIEAASGHFDGSLNTQLRRLYDVLTGQ
jgi:flagellar assembly protein FliH